MSNTQKPYLLIVAGPTGSGKGSLPKKVIKYLDLNKKYDSIIIDDLVEKNKFYKKEVYDFLNSMTAKERIRMFNNPTIEELNIFNNFYYKARKEIECTSDKEVNVGDETTCDKQNDKKMTTAFEKGHNILFETQGTYWPDWIWKTYKEHVMNFKYHIIVAWTVADMCVLINRNKSRAVESVKGFIEDYKNRPAPRLPDISFKTYKDKLEKIIQVFNKEIKKGKNKQCFTNRDNKQCVDIRYLVFDNTNKSETPEYDSKEKNKDEGEKVIKIYGIDKNRKNCSNKENNGNIMPTKNYLSNVQLWKTKGRGKHRKRKSSKKRISNKRKSNKRISKKKKRKKKE